jgi:cytidylate kinase
MTRMKLDVKLTVLVTAAQMVALRRLAEREELNQSALVRALISREAARVLR